MVVMPARALDLVGSREACEILKITRSTLNYWMLTGRIQPAQVTTGASGRISGQLWDRAEVERLAAERRAS